MKVKDFSLSVNDGTTETSDGYVRLVHGQQYAVMLGNHCHRKTDCVLTIDGKEIATFQLHPFRTAVIETDPDDKGKGKFTFYRTDSEEGAVVGAAKIDKDLRGVVRAEFRPEKYRPPVAYHGAGAQSVTRTGGRHPTAIGQLRRRRKNVGRHRHAQDDQIDAVRGDGNVRPLRPTVPDRPAGGV